MKPDYKMLWWESMRLKHPGMTDDEIRQMMKDYGSRNDGTKSPLYKNPERAREIRQIQEQGK